MSKGTDIFNFLNPWNHINQGKTVKTPEYTVTDTKTGETHTVGGNEYDFTIKETANPALGGTMNINSTTTSADVSNAINDYNAKIDEYNQKQLDWAKQQAAQQQTNFETELALKQQERADQILENETTRMREDTYYQRMIKDLAQAGINPLMAGHLGGAGVSGGQVASMNISGTSPVGLNMTTPQSQAGVYANMLNSERDYDIMLKQNQLEKEKIQEAKRHNQEEESTELLRVKKEMSFAYAELKSANLNAYQERECKKALNNMEFVHTLLLNSQKFNQSKELQSQAEEAKKELQESVNKIQAFKTGNEIVDTIVNLAITILRFLQR